ncbi:MAG: TrmH family RNA methyltransferase [Blautia sp.]|jgi:TrmH family RNA methyltransferase
MITSAANAQVKNVIQLNQRAKARREQGLFVAEGRKMFLEAPRDWIHKVYLSSTVVDPDWEAALADIPYEIVEEKVFRQMSDTKTPQGVLTLLKTPSYSFADLMRREHPLLVLLEDLQDPGNVGTILRTAEGAGADGVLLTKRTADLLQPKVIRSTMGSIYRMPFYQLGENPAKELEQLKKMGICSYAAHLRGEHTYDREDYTKGTLFFIGNEGNGLSEALTGMADRLIRIPMAGQVESLNAAMAAGILMYEAARQRR